MQTRSIPSFDDLPNTGYARQSQLIRGRTCRRKSHSPPLADPLPTPLPFSASTLWRKVRDGTFPAPVKLGPKTTVWRVSEVRKWLADRVEVDP